jgi:alpha-tubulin suppressor-like RCC1 family protein
MNICAAVLCPKKVEALAEIELDKLCGGACHTLALSKYGTVFMWGKTALKSTSKPEEIKFNDEEICDIYSTANSCLARTKTGRLFIWGMLCDGISYYLPTMISALNDHVVERVWTDCWAESILIKCKDGTIYAWGRNENGQLGIGTRARTTNPEKVISLQDKNVVHASFGETSGFVIIITGFEPYKFDIKNYADILITINNL